MKKFVVNVTNDDIRHGVKNHENKCPIARACRRAGIERPFVGGDDLVFGRANRYGVKKSVPLPASAENFVSRFDRNFPVKPFKFVIEIA